jgi:hypothetical protein
MTPSVWFPPMLGTLTEVIGYSYGDAFRTTRQPRLGGHLQS